MISNKPELISPKTTKKKINFPFLAKKLGISYTKFRRDFREQTGIAPNQYLQQIRLQQASSIAQIIRYAKI